MERKETSPSTYCIPLNPISLPFQRINKRQLKKLKALHAELAIDEIELKARECIIDEFKNTLKLTKQQICGAGDVIGSSSQPDTTEYTSQENFLDCVFSPSAMSQRADENNSASVGPVAAEADVNTAVNDER